MHEQVCYCTAILQMLTTVCGSPIVVTCKEEKELNIKYFLHVPVRLRKKNRQCVQEELI